MITKASVKALDLIKKYEGLRLEAYQDSAGVWTIGWGHIHNACPGKVITMREAEMFLKWDVEDTERVINFLNLNLTQNQYDALVSWVFNLGIGNLKRSTLFKIMSQDPNDPAIRTEWIKWRKAGGVVLHGLVKRRKEEIDLYFTI